MIDTLPDPICMMCCKECLTTEVVNTGGEYELWCWCKECGIDTFHQLPESMRKYGWDRNDKITTKESIT